MCKWVLFSPIKLGIIFSVLLVIFCVNLSDKILKRTDVNKCPFCYGENLCDAFANFSSKKTVFAVILNLLNTKNVFYANFNDDDVVLKKLASDEELRKLDERICMLHDVSDNCDLSKLPDTFDYKNKLREFLNDGRMFRSFKLCSESSAKIMMDYFLKLRASDAEENDFLRNLWTTVQINVEPLILQLLKSDENYWPVPKYYGSCGRFVVEEYCGTPLTYGADLSWTERARVALQLLQLAGKFTDNHPHFRFYLTDLSSDNLVVDDDLKLTIVDLENILVTLKNESDVGAFHQSEVLHEEGNFAYSEESICNSALSDHNYFAVCKLLLSRAAEWPMMKNGLLHDPPDWVVSEHEDLFDLIENCAVPSEETNRITASENIINILNSILVKAETTINLNHEKRTEIQKVDL